jgi:hypothetical protein
VNNHFLLLENGKCISGTIKMHNVLVSGTKVKLYGLDVTDYNEDVAKKSVSGLVNMVRSCFPNDGIPIDLEELLEDLVKDPLNVIQTSLLKAAATAKSGRHASCRQRLRPHGPPPTYLAATHRCMHVLLGQATAGVRAEYARDR